VYPDGKTFRFQDMVSLEYMEAVKASDEKFKDIDIEKISEKDGLLIYRTSVVDGDEDKADLSINDKIYDYRFVAEGKYFPNQEIANEFLRALAAYPAEYTKSSLEKVDFKKNLLLYGSSSIKRYNDKLSILNNEYDYLVSQYNSLISSFGDSLIVNEKSLRVWLNELQTAYSSYERQSLSDNLSRYGYTFDDEVFSDTNDDLVYELQSNTKNIANNKALYEDLVKNGSGITSETTILNTISDLEKRNASIEYTLEYRGIEVEDRNASIWTWKKKADTTAYDRFCSESEAFGEKLDQVKTTLENQADICKTVISAAYGQQARVLFANNQLEELNTTSTAMAAVLSLIIGFVVVAVVVLIIYMPKYAKKKREEIEGVPARTPVLVESEQVAEAAATQSEEPDGKKE
ncbi:MAG: hypothetical protein ACI4QN_00675, partial [Candidatus Coproplasma sp.]